MRVDFLAKVRAGNAKVAGSGFGGKGLDKFESEREKVDRAQRSAYGEDGQIVEKPETKKDGAAEEADFKFKDFNVEIVKGPAPERLMSVSIPQNRSDVKLGQDVSTLPPQTKAALDRAAAAGKNVQESLANAVAKIQASLNKTKADNRGVAGPSAKTESSAPDYHAIVPINDYPQKARWKATNKEQMVALQDLSGASITNKGESLTLEVVFVLMTLCQASFIPREPNLASDKNPNSTFSSKATKSFVSSWRSTSCGGSCWKHLWQLCRAQTGNRLSLEDTRYEWARSNGLVWVEHAR